MEIKELQELNNKLIEEYNLKFPNNWDDYEWMTGRMDYVIGQLNLLEKLLK